MEEPSIDAEQIVKFTLRGQFDPDEITKLVGLAPTGTTRAGDLVHSGEDYRRLHSSWDIRSTGDESLPVDRQIRGILEILEPKWEELIQLSSRFEAAFQCRVYIQQAQGPELYLARDVVKRIAELGAYVDFDVYCLGSNDE